MQIEPGLVLLQGRLSRDDQRILWEMCNALAHGPVPMYTPTVRGGRKMSVGMLCLGRHWNALTYQYEVVFKRPEGKKPPQQIQVGLAREGKYEIHASGFPPK